MLVTSESGIEARSGISTSFSLKAPRAIRFVRNIVIGE
jgi:hypothetical protein